MIKRQEYRIELALTIFLFVVVNVLSQILQQPVSFNNGQGWDGVIYFKVANQLATHMLPNAEAPYVYRVGTPLLVAIFFGSDLLLGFKIVNIAGNLLTTVLFVFWLRLYLNDRKTRVLLVTLFLVMFHGPVRLVYYSPVYTDPWFFVVLLTGLIGIQKTQANATILRICFLGLIVFVGVIFREAALIIPIAFLFSANPLVLSREMSSALASFQIKRVVKGIPLTFFIPLGFGILGLVIVWLTATQNNSYSFNSTAFFWAYEKPLLTYLHAWFITFGPFIIFPIYYWRGAIRFLTRNQFMLIYLLGFSVLAWIGGSDTERILFWSMPVVYLLIGISIEDNSILEKFLPIELFILLAVQLISERVLWTIPDYPNEFSTPLPILAILSNNFQPLDLWSYHGSRSIEAVSFLEYLLLSILILWWLNYRSKNSEPKTPTKIQ